MGGGFMGISMAQAQKLQGAKKIAVVGLMRKYM